MGSFQHPRFNPWTLNQLGLNILDQTRIQIPSPCQGPVWYQILADGDLRYYFTTGDILNSRHIYPQTAHINMDPSHYASIPLLVEFPLPSPPRKQNQISTLARVD